MERRSPSDPRAPLSRRAVLARGAGVAAAAAFAEGALSACSAPRAEAKTDASASVPAKPTAKPAPDPAAASDARAELDELFANLRDESTSIAPISSAERSARRARLASILRELGTDAILMESGSTMTHLSGVTWGKSERLFALVCLADGTHFWLCPAFEESKARLRTHATDGPGGDYVSWQEDEHAFRPLADALRARRVERVMIEPQLRWIFADRLAETFGRERVISGFPAVLKLRGRKEEHELALIRRACELTQTAIAAVAATLQPGLTGADIAARIDRAHEKLGMRGPWSLCLIDAAAALPHGEQHDLVLSKGSLLLMDVGASLHGYQSDISRTFVHGAPPSAEIARVWQIVRDAQQAAFDALRPGTVCKDIDAAARSVIDRGGFGPGFRTFTHRLGHGIGLEGHEDPYFDGGSDIVLEPGMTLSNEPGIYLPGQFGVRIEDIVAITAAGGEHFGNWQTSPSAPA